MEVEITTGDLGRPYRAIGPVQVRVTSLTLLSAPRTIEEADRKLRTAAVAMGANAVVGVQYQRGISMTSWKALTAWGTAVLAEAPTFPCPGCGAVQQLSTTHCSGCRMDLVAAQAETTKAYGFTMSADGSHWWDGASWRDAGAEAPPAAPRSPQGRTWWDGRIWRPVPL